MDVEFYSRVMFTVSGDAPEVSIHKIRNMQYSRMDMIASLEIAF
jgi:hypothetical protein